MRWLSSFALLIMLSLWCTPQAFAVHDSRLSPLADTALHAVVPVLSETVCTDTDDSTDHTQPALHNKTFSEVISSQGQQYSSLVWRHQAEFFTATQCRAPPSIPSL